MCESGGLVLFVDVREAGLAIVLCKKASDKTSTVMRRAQDHHNVFKITKGDIQ